MVLSIYFKTLMLKKYINSERSDMMFECLLQSPLDEKKKSISKRYKSK